MSSPIPDPGAVPDGPNFTDLPSDEPPTHGGPVPPRPPQEDDDGPGTTPGPTREDGPA